MRQIRIVFKYAEGLYEVVDKVNKQLQDLDVQIVLVRYQEPKPKPEYDDNRVYQTGERARDSRLDRRSVRGEAALFYLT